MEIGAMMAGGRPEEGTRKGLAPANEAEMGSIVRKTGKPQLLGLRRSALLEIGLFFILALLIDHFLFGGGRFGGFSLHPFWLIVILISAQYGTGEGLVAAGVASTCLLAGNLPEQTLSQDMYQYLYAVCRLPLAWFVTALVLGEIRMRHIRECDKLQNELAASEEREKELARSHENLCVVKDKLEARVAGQLTTAITMYQAARDLEKLEPAEVLRGMVGIVHAVMRPEKFSIYLLKDNQLTLAIHEGWNQHDTFSRAFHPGSPLFQALIGRQRYLCSASRDDEVILAQEGVLAGPLISEESGEVSGILKIEKLSFMRLNFSNVQTFRVLCQWIASAYANARRFEIARSESVLNEKTQLLSYGYFRQHTAHLAELARRLGFDLSMLVIRLENKDDLLPEQRSLIPGFMSQAVTVVLRKTDLVFEHQRSGYEYAVVLPNTPVANAQIVADKLLRYLSQLSREKAAKANFVSSIQSIHREERSARIWSGEIIPRQVEFFRRLAERVGFDVFLVEFRPTQRDELTPEMRGAIHPIMTRILEQRSEPGKTVALSVPMACVYQILFFGIPAETTRASVDALSIDIAGQIEHARIPVRMTYTVQALHLQNDNELQYERR
jgi:polysaccharide biosynthesis protein PelD